MAKYWIEILDIRQWRTSHGGKDREFGGKKIDNLICPVSYHIEVCGFTFRFSGRDELEEYIQYFSRKTHPSTRMKLEGTGDHYDTQTRFTRLPPGLNSNHKRPLVLKALKMGTDEFFNSSS